jgi:hypothetical protein
LELSIVSENPVIPVWSIGLTPISPVIKVVPVVEIPDFANITKSPDVPRFTGAGPNARAEAAAIAGTVTFIATVLITTKIAAHITPNVAVIFIFHPFLIPLSPFSPFLL